MRLTTRVRSAPIPIALIDDHSVPLFPQFNLTLNVLDPLLTLPLVHPGIVVDARCRVGGLDTKRGRVAYVGDVAEIPGVGPWIGVVLDEPVGKYDGCVGGKKYFQCRLNCCVFVRCEKVEIGDFRPLGLEEELDSDLEEI